MTLLQTGVQALVNVISLEGREGDLTLGRLLEMLRTKTPNKPHNAPKR
jgi:hypothetical protein